MGKSLSMEAVSQVEVELSAPQWRLPDTATIARNALSEALSFAAQKMGLADPRAAVDRLQQGDGTAHGYFRYSVATHVAESLGALDENVKAVYIVDYDATPEDMCFGKGTGTLLVHLIVWAERKTSALGSLVEALDHALVQHYADLVGARQLAHLLDVQVVNDEDVKNRAGYGAMLSSLHQRPIQVWKR